ncbi:TetR/AcrR family transcriptional regulator [Micromonospora yasonensis]|uniref:TetR/AcrR family transcriptional regulator n=1 Tax=Micromonospora yasonensis TaxID=1128667 RepID=UPI00222FB57D|nr:TetR/AcrR family transcriptional regulator [Micromonospora yasonensis]MCW3841616.1 TetR/AcrR family transcriptional regulator [Micromonospora yasonensis]
MQTELGLRERKKRQTREAITAAAFELFADHGFDGVKVAEVARRANVSEATVFNYFPTKEDLVYGRLEELEAALLRAIQERPAGQPISAAFRGFILGQRGLLGASDPEARERLATVSRIIANSPALLARERQVYDRYTRALAELIREERSVGPDDVESWAVANAVFGVHRGLVEYVRRNVLAGRGGPRLAQAVRAQAERALAVLDRGLDGYPDCR